MDQGSKILPVRSELGTVLILAASDVRPRRPKLAAVEITPRWMPALGSSLRLCFAVLSCSWILLRETKGVDGRIPRLS